VRRRTAWQWGLLAVVALPLAWEGFSLLGPGSWDRARQMFASPWRDDGEADVELTAFAAALRQGMHPHEVEDMVGRFRRLTASGRGQGVVRVATPARLDYRNRVAWLAFAPGLIEARYGTADSLGPIDDMPDLPKDECFVDEKSCRLFWLRR